VTAEKKDVIEIKQELDLLRREIRARDSNPRRGRTDIKPDIGPEDARALIRSMVGEGASDSAIISLLSRLGAPRTWTEERLSGERAELKLDDKLAQSE
jgi:hypothetical protein